ncbi:MAG: hypothetical protein A2268_08440 [Candidatus Raymondbacteria bacterium RifOxyA12_full_50_37]|uniref:Lipopolysaccharide heptosyltransferase II n=1 Tax=Candidatus Raymondbacteria bacterium RIFOXYD12_FULL_49_13 TaxID=1817890 RepID=A0A1F7F3R0_UNCRA|nr:MAG: hypothetical protein A2268_08440 [Candidatus Raymondbacteria bacterium RifOxyA12_full_50_37]OGJ90361.1 MAG: hypothetical protein A2248_17375 [Candidatus Raymondbacteria bacterium RIFOXYA2_FULL_49_16]OGK01304.1 MAG: hypothetical protein A2519_12940 [Candidatus Raymondbacteria bacterium RIFOXYD12_FULL_49_13]OGK04447.1 MAG: hypothetical protein A2487_14640 [Candidatus Raymondbacteria bacterium RifOxyC12_full_50_8]OGP43260.1 MAG: hypothetical protein A2324_08205 [Candidatus Raymondbacteria 
MDRALFIRFSSIGDIVLTTPVLRCFARRYPSVKIDFLTKEAYAPLLQYNPYVAEVIPLKTGLLDELLAFRQVMARTYRLVVDLHKNMRSMALTAGLTGPRVVWYDKLTMERNLLALLQTRMTKAWAPVPLRYLGAVTRFGVEDDGEGLEFHSHESHARAAEDLLAPVAGSGNKLIALAPGSRWYTKQWPLKKFAEVVNLLPEFEFVILGDERDGAVAEKIQFFAKRRILNLAGKTDIMAAGEVLRRCCGLVANDSGLMHLGCAVKTPTVALFGSTVEEFGFFPFRAKARVLQKPVKCRPCGTIGKNTCKIQTLECLESISALEVVAALNGLLNS